MATQDNPWRTLSSREIYHNPWIGVREDKVVQPNGGDGIYGVVSFKNLAIGVLPIDLDGSTYLVGQYRYPLGVYSWELPEGGGARDTAPLLSAQRELKEETGLQAGDWREFLRMDLSNSVSDETAICFLALDLVQGEAEPEDNEVLEVKRVSFQKALSMALDGEITDAMSVAMLLKARLLALQGALPAPICDRLAQ